MGADVVQLVVRNIGRDKIAHHGGLQVSLRELAPGMPTTDHVSDKD
jgi:hypothetical protein